MLLDLVVDCLPSPLDRPPVEGIAPEDQGDGRPQAGPEGAVRGAGVQDGRRADRRPGVHPRLLRRAEAGRDVPEHDHGKTERIARIYRMMGDKRQELEEAGPGDIVAVVGLKDTYTGHTLCDPDRRSPWSRSRFPKPVIAQALIVGQDARQPASSARRWAGWSATTRR